jgi:hypothetical protein
VQTRAVSTLSSVMRLPLSVHAESFRIATELLLVAADARTPVCMCTCTCARTLITVALGIACTIIASASCGLCRR